MQRKWDIKFSIHFFVFTFSHIESAQNLLAGSCCTKCWYARFNLGDFSPNVSKGGRQLTSATSLLYISRFPSRRNQIIIGSVFWSKIWFQFCMTAIFSWIQTTVFKNIKINIDKKILNYQINCKNKKLIQTFKTVKVKLNKLPDFKNCFDQLYQSFIS